MYLYCFGERYYDGSYTKQYKHDTKFSDEEIFNIMVDIYCTLFEEDLREEEPILKPWCVKEYLCKNELLLEIPWFSYTRRGRLTEELQKRGFTELEFEQSFVIFADTPMVSEQIDIENNSITTKVVKAVTDKFMDKHTDYKFYKE